MRQFSTYFFFFFFKFSSIRKHKQANIKQQKQQFFCAQKLHKRENCLFAFFYAAKCSLKKNKLVENCPDGLIYYTIDVYPFQPLYWQLFFTKFSTNFSYHIYLFLFLCTHFICQNLFLFMIVCENLFLFMTICENLFFWARIFSYS